MRAQAIQDDFGIVSRGMAWRAAKTPPKSGAGALRIAPASPPPLVLMMPAGWYLDAYNRACLGQPPIPWREPLPTGKVYARALAEYLDIPEAVAVGAQRTRQLARPRQSAMYICRLATGMSLPQIGQIFGGRDHTTVMHAIAAVSGRLNDAETSEAEAAQIRAIKEIADRITRYGK